MDDKKPRGGIMDPDKWKKAEKEAKKGNYDDLGAVTRKIYEKMGGRFAKARSDPITELEELIKARPIDPVDRLEELVS